MGDFHYLCRNMISNQDFLEALSTLGKFRQTANRYTFVKIFGTRIGEHLWWKFNKNHDVIDLYLTLDDDNTAKLAAYLSTLK